MSGPVLEEVNAAISDGFVNISWTFSHTGGLDILRIESVCHVDGACRDGAV